MLIDMIILRAALVRSPAGRDVEVRQRDIGQPAEADDARDTADRRPAASGSTKR